MPNIIVLLAGDMGYGEPRCYNPASKIPTPNMDRIAAESLRSTDVHTPAAVCTPTRYGNGRCCSRTRLQNRVLWSEYEETSIDPTLTEKVLGFMERDLHEETNVIASEPELVARLQAELSPIRDARS